MGVDAPAILVAYYAQATATRIEALSNEEVGNVLIKSLRSCFGETMSHAKLLDVTVVRWASDPFALGSYSVGATLLQNDFKSAICD